MKIILTTFVLLVSINSFAKDLNCQYTNHDGKKGTAAISIDEDNLNVKLVFKSITVTSQKCKMTLKPDEITVECDEDGNSIGVILELIDGKLEGVLISEKAGVFGEANC